jgi:hypothetical protein
MSFRIQTRQIGVHWVRLRHDADSRLVEEGKRQRLAKTKRRSLASTVEAL